MEPEEFADFPFTLAAHAWAGGTGFPPIRVVLTPPAAAHPLRFHCASTALPLRWLKLGKTGNHLFPGGRYLWF